MKYPIPFILLAGLLLGCQAASSWQHATPTPYYSSEQGMAQSLVVFSDDFSDPNSGWGLRESELGSRIGYEHQGLRIVVNEVNTDFWSTPQVSEQDASIAVDASKLGGPDDNYFGLICRMLDNRNYYAFLISSDGYYGIIKVKEGTLEILSSSSMDYSPVINRSRGTNRIRGECIGSDLTLFINGESVTRVQDGDLSYGKVGLIAGSNDQIGVDILFDNFVIYSP